jgi:hypothetical protein
MVNMMSVKEKELNTLNIQSKVNEAPLREAGKAYREVPGLRHETKDVLRQLEANVQSLEDLGGRLTYVLCELRGLIRR